MVPRSARGLLTVSTTWSGNRKRGTCGFFPSHSNRMPIALPSHFVSTRSFSAGGQELLPGRARKEIQPVAPCHEPATPGLMLDTPGTLVPGSLCCPFAARQGDLERRRPGGGD